jgi:hypothetical protein
MYKYGIFSCGITYSHVELLLYDTKLYKLSLALRGQSIMFVTNWFFASFQIVCFLSNTYL